MSQTAGSSQTLPRVGHPSLHAQLQQAHQHQQQQQQQLAASAYNVQTLSGVTYSICPPPPPSQATATYTYQMQIQGTCTCDIGEPGCCRLESYARGVRVIWIMSGRWNNSGGVLFDRGRGSKVCGGGFRSGLPIDLWPGGRGGGIMGRVLECWMKYPN